MSWDYVFDIMAPNYHCYDSKISLMIIGTAIRCAKIKTSFALAHIAKFFKFSKWESIWLNVNSEKNLYILFGYIVWCKLFFKLFIIYTCLQLSRYVIKHLTECLYLRNVKYFTGEYFLSLRYTYLPNSTTTYRYRTRYTLQYI